MEISTGQLIGIIGAKDVELYLLRQRIATLEAAIAALTPQSDVPVPLPAGNGANPSPSLERANGEAP